MESPDQVFADALAEYVGCKKPFCFIRRSDKEMESRRSFDMEYNRVVNSIPELNKVAALRKYRDNASLFAMASSTLEIVRSICYRPDGDQIIDRNFNMWTDPGIEPLDGEPTIFLEHLNYLIPNQLERVLLLSWLAWIVQHPDQKVMYAILIVGRGGTGKSWLGKLMERIFGADNVVLISEEDALTSTFNGFSENKRLVFVHESPPKEIEDLLGKLKGLITERGILINRKGIERYKAENFANLMVISNEEIRINRTNRRRAVIRAADDAYGLDERGRETKTHAEYYKRLWNVIPDDGTITDELRRTVNYLGSYDLTDFNRLIAPLTGTKEEASETGDDGKLQARVSEAYKNREGPFRFDLLTADDVAKHVGGSHEAKTLTAAMEEVGCRKLRGYKGRDVQISIDGGKRPRLWAINPAVAKHHASTELAELTALYKEDRAGKPAAKPMMPVGDWEADFEPGDQPSIH